MKSELIQAIKTVRMGQKESVHKGLRVKTNGSTVGCSLKVIGIGKPEQMKGLMLVVFEEDKKDERPPIPEKEHAGGAKHNDRIEELEHELSSVKEHLQSTIEELETSNEELQSVNEELMTVNAEAQERIERLTRATNDMRNLLNSTKIAVVFLDLDLRLKSFTPPAVRIFKFIESDIGRPISDIVNMLSYEHLNEDMLKVLNNLIPLEKQILDNNGFWYLMKILPYRTHNNMIDGIVVTFVDISKQKHVESALTQTKEIRGAIIDTSGEGLVLIDRQSGSIVDSNLDFQTLTGRKTWEMEDLKIWDLMPEGPRETVRKLFQQKRALCLQEKETAEFLGTDGKPVEVEMRSRVLPIGGRKYVQSLVTRARKKA